MICRVDMSSVLPAGCSARIRWMAYYGFAWPGTGLMGCLRHCSNGTMFEWHHVRMAPLSFPSALRSDGPDLSDLRTFYRLQRVQGGGSRKAGSGACRERLPSGYWFGVGLHSRINMIFVAL